MSRFLTKVWLRGILVLMLPTMMAAGARADEVTDWHEHMIVAVRNAGLVPMTSTREAALVSSAVFDAVNGIERRHTPIYVPPAAPPGASKRAAAVQAAYAILLARFPGQSDDLHAKREASLAAIGEVHGKSVQRGLAWGQTVAEAILEWRSTDGFSPPPPAYFGGNVPGQWRPTPPAFLPGAAVQFATMTPWGIVSPDQFRPLPPPALDSVQYLIELDEVKATGSIVSPFRTADQTDACLFHAASTSTYFWNRTAIDLLLDRRGHSDKEFSGEGAALLDHAKLLAQLNLGIADAVIACWDAKYFYEFWRPVTAIRLGNPEDEDWTPLVVTPPFPEYTSGHSSIAGAATTVLADYFGNETPFVLESQMDPSWIRFYPSFSSAIDEIADARVFAGIHFRTACDEGAAMGSDVAAYVLENLMQRVHGKGN